MKTEIREYCEKMNVEVKVLTFEETYDREADGRIGICALNEGGYNGTIVDLEDVLLWVCKNRPDILSKYTSTLVIS